jgi:hypothetical protein
LKQQLNIHQYGSTKSKDEKIFLETGWMDEDIYIVFQQYFAAKATSNINYEVSI